MDQNRNTLFTRIDYIQVGLTSKNSLKLIRKISPQIFEIAIGDYSGSLHYFLININTNQAETIFKTLPGPNAKITCIDAYSGLKSSGSTKILIVYGPSMIKGFNKKGKQFFALELNNLTEPIRMFKMHRSPDEIHVLGQYIYNSFLVNTELVASGGTFSSNSSNQTKTSTSIYNSVVRSRHYYVCPAQINDFILLEDRFGRKIVPVLACQDRLLRVLKDSECNFEIEVCGIPSVLQIVPKHLYNYYLPLDSDKNFNDNDLIIKNRKAYDNDINICYGTMDGKVALVTFHFLGKDQLEPLHYWEIPINTIKQPITCLKFSDSQPEFYIGRSDGTIEIWRLNESIKNDDDEQRVDLTVQPSLIDSYNCSESITNLIAILVGERGDLLLLCATFTGMVFGLLQYGHAKQMRQLNPNFLLISKENADRIRLLQEECQRLEKQLDMEQKNYSKHTSKLPAVSSSISSNASQLMTQSDLGNEENLSVLPFFAINDSFILHNDSSYVLLLEVEISLDVVVLHCNLPLDLIDCERNSAVISFNDHLDTDDVLVTFRCQTNTSRLEIRLRPVEGQHGIITIYVISRITPKSCQTKSYNIQPLSLHKRQYSNTRIENPNTLAITGSFGINDAHTWLQMCIPEIPEKLSRTISDIESEVFYYASTITKSILICNCGHGIITMTSDNVSTISILKDFITREATRQSIEIEINLDLNEKSLHSMLSRLYPKIRQLIQAKQCHDLSDSLADLKSSDANIANELLTDLNLHSSIKDISNNEWQNTIIGLDRLYGIITDLFIDYNKLKNSSIVNSLVSMVKKKLPEMIEMIETMILDSFDYDLEFLDMTASKELFMIENELTNPPVDNEFVESTDPHSVNVNYSKQKNYKIDQNNDPNINCFIDRLFQFWTQLN